MTKKDYELIAYCLMTTNITNQLGDESALRQRFAEWFAVQLKLQNPNFDADKFARACGLRVLEDTDRLSE